MEDTIKWKEDKMEDTIKWKEDKMKSAWSMQDMVYRLKVVTHACIGIWRPHWYHLYTCCYYHMVDSHMVSLILYTWYMYGNRGF